MVDAKVPWERYEEISVKYGLPPDCTYILDRQLENTLKTSGSLPTEDVRIRAKISPQKDRGATPADVSGTFRGSAVLGVFVVTGRSYCQDVLRTLTCGDPIMIAADDQNAHDCNAVKVLTQCVGGSVCG